MSYRLKKGQEAFQVVDGPFAKRRYTHGAEYADADVPPRERHKFEMPKVPKVPKMPKVLKGNKAEVDGA